MLSEDESAARRRGRPGQPASTDHRCRRFIEGGAASEDLIDHHTIGVHVRCGRVAARPGQAFRRQPQPRPHRGAAAAPSGRGRYVGDLAAETGVDKHVGRLEVAVQHGGQRAVQEPHPLRHSLEEAQRRVGVEGERAVVQQVPEAPQLHQLHHQTHAPLALHVELRDPQHRHDPGVPDPHQRQNVSTQPPPRPSPLPQRA